MHASLASRHGRSGRKGRNGRTSSVSSAALGVPAPTCHCEKARSAGRRGNPSRPPRSNVRANQLDRHVAARLAMTNGVGGPLWEERVDRPWASALARAPQIASRQVRKARFGVRRLDAALRNEARLVGPGSAIGAASSRAVQSGVKTTALHSRAPARSDVARSGRSAKSARSARSM